MPSEFTGLFILLKGKGVNMNKTETIFRTQDLYLASFLMARGDKLIKVENPDQLPLSYLRTRMRWVG